MSLITRTLLTLKSPSHWLNPLCPVSWLDEHRVCILQKEAQKKDDKVYDSVAQLPLVSDSTVSIFAPGSNPRWLGGPYLRLDSECQGEIFIIIWGSRTLVMVDYPWVGKIGACALPKVRQRQRSCGDMELLGNYTDNSEQDESSSLRLSWSLVSQCWQVS